MIRGSDGVGHGNERNYLAMSQRTTSVAKVSDDQARTIGRMVEDAARKYSGGSVKMELVKGDPDFLTELYALWDRRANLRGQALAIGERPTWKTIKLGTHPSTDALRQALVDGGYRIGDWASDILKRTPIAPEPLELDLILVTVADLGFPEGATRENIYEKAAQLGLTLCPAEVGPALRLDYAAQPKGEWILVGMEPIADSRGYLEVFDVDHGDSGRWLRSDYGYPDDFWHGCYRWVFVRKS